MAVNLTFGFCGRTAIVTGAARGIGLELARHLHVAGAAVYLLDYDTAEASSAAEQLGAIAVSADVSSTQEVEAAVRRVIDETGRLDIVVNNAGVLRDSIPAERKSELAGAIPLGRFADPSEMCAAVSFLASEEAGYITGTVLPVDGGISM